jgi:hypothetical protein
MTQPAGPPPSSSTSDPPGPETPPSTAAVPNGPGTERDQPDGKQDKPDRDGKGGKEDDRNKDGLGHPVPSTGPTEPQRDNSQTPGSTARGAVTAVPPIGAKPPSQGG